MKRVVITSLIEYSLMDQWSEQAIVELVNKKMQMTYVLC